MPVEMPTTAQLAKVVEQLRMSLSDTDLENYRVLCEKSVEACNLIDGLEEDLPEVRYGRSSGYRPSAEENTHNAWYYKTSVKGATTGKLAGKRIALKDNVMLAGVPMMNGASTLEGYVPEIDATIVTRMLDEGAEIVGKAACEYLCMSASSFTSATGVMHNPYRRGYSGGGSSSGSGIVVALGEADMAIGGDQGGSIRIPAALCGIYGMKPTWGLVPYTGIAPLEFAIDHAGPMTATVADNALLLEVIAGEDGFDFRQRPMTPQSYSRQLDGGVAGMRIALVKEGFGWAGGDANVDATVRAAATRLEQLGAKVDEVSIPMHRLGWALIVPVVASGVVNTVIEGDGFGANRPDLYVTSLMHWLHQARDRSDEFPPNVKAMVIFATYLQRRYGGRYYAKAINLSRQLRAAYDTVLREYDLLLMPTTQTAALPLPASDAPLDQRVARAFEYTANTKQFDLTHHPAMSVPCGMVDGMPVGMMLVGRHFDEATIYRAAYAFEQSCDWKDL